MKDNDVKQKALSIIRRENMLTAGDAVLVGLSGGADSMTLLHVLLELRDELGLCRVAAAHVNHGLRGEEAARDEQFVRQYCAAHEVPLFLCHADVAAAAQAAGQGIEETGRQIRYAFFAETAEKNGFTRIATAHTRSDVTETILLHMVRGCGLQGISGISPTRGQIIRPLLDCTRAEIETYCAEQKLAYVTDSTNTDTVYARNRLRHCVVPELYRINPQIEEAFARLAGTARRDAAFLQEFAQRALEQVRSPAGKAGRYDRKRLGELSEAIAVRVLMLAAEESGATGCEDRHAEAMLQLREAEGAVTLPGNIIVRTNGQLLQIEPCSAPPESFSFLALSGSRYEIAGSTYVFEILSREKFEFQKKIHKILLKNAFNYDKIEGNIRIENRQPGDAFHPAGRGVGKTLKKLFNEAKLPEQQRAATPILRDEQGIVLVYGFGCDKRVAVDNAATQIAVLYLV